MDIGCGHGLFSLALACAQLGRRIRAVDPSLTKIEIAMRVGRNCPSVEFRPGPVDCGDGERFDVILLIDVLYLLAYEKKLALLRTCRNLLAPNGTLIVKVNDTHPAWKYTIAHAQEKFMTGAGFTLGHGGLHFLSCRENNDLLNQAGFTAELSHLVHWTPYPHVVFAARPQAIGLADDFEKNNIGFISG